MGIDTWIVDIKGFCIINMDDEQFATLQASLDSNSCDGPDYYGADQFKACKDELQKDLQSLPGNKHLNVYTEDAINNWDWCVFGWENYDQCHDPSDEDLDTLKKILEKHGFEIDGRIEKNRFVTYG